MSASDWANKEFEGVKLGDKRLNERLSKIAEQFLATPQSPINKACQNWGETKAAYRFFQNDHVDYLDIVNHHANQTKLRCTDENTILAIQDTTYFNYTDHPKTKGLGVLSRFSGKHKKDIFTMGLYMHTTLAVTTEGLPLGVLDQKITAREVLPKEKSELKKRSHNIALPIEEKESIRWLNSMNATCSVFNSQSKRIVTVADREADIYELFLHAKELNTHFLIRASQNRKINKSTIHSEVSGEMLWDFMAKQNSLGKTLIKVPRKENQPKRVAKCNIKVGKVRVLPTRHFKGSKSRNLELDIYVIQVVEENTPKGASKIEWMLYSSMPVLNYDDAIEKIGWYCLRWRIEVYFKVIKSGFNVEKCRLETAERLIRYLAVIGIVAWRVFWLTLVSRTTPNKLSTCVLSDEEWKVLYLHFHPKRKIPKRVPTVKTVTRWIAQLGGFQARPADGQPGIIYITRGLHRLEDMLVGFRLYGCICG
jgi:hypothetical protein